MSTTGVFEDRVAHCCLRNHSDDKRAFNRGRVCREDREAFEVSGFTPSARAESGSGPAPAGRYQQGDGGGQGASDVFDTPDEPPGLTRSRDAAAPADDKEAAAMRLFGCRCEEIDITPEPNPYDLGAPVKDQRLKPNAAPARRFESTSRDRAPPNT